MDKDRFESWIQQIHVLVRSERVAFKKHCILRMRQRAISVDEFKEAMTHGEPIEYYEDDHPLASALILGYTSSGRPLHAVVALDKSNEKLWTITLYEPNTEQWEDQFKKRRS